MKYVGIKHTGELRVLETQNPDVDDVYLVIEPNKLGPLPFKPFEFVHWNGSAWEKVTGVELATTLDISEAVTEIENLISDSIERVIAADYADLTFPIAEGTQCCHDGGYFYANTSIATSEDWTAAHWTETSVANQIGNVEALLAAL